jgi:hypothetical protein
MPTCYFCGCAILRGQGNRRRVNTGYSIAGFNFTSSPVLSWLMNSLVSNRKASIRSYYSVQTLCAPCATKRDAQERRKLLLLSVGAILFALLFVILVAVRH